MLPWSLKSRCFLWFFKFPLAFSAAIRHIVTTYKQVGTICLEIWMKKRPEEIFRKHGGQLRMSEAIKHGITRYMLYSLRDKGIIERVSRGIYRLVELPPISNPDLVKLSVLNSRMKDFYDIWLLSRQFDFDGAELAEAVRMTFDRRGTALPAEIEAFTEPFISAKQTQWAAFWKKLGQDHVPASFGEIVVQVDGFLSPIVASLSSGKPNPTDWNAPGPWF